MQIRIEALANLGQAQTQFAALTRQVELFNAELKRSSMVPMGGSVKGFASAQSAARSANREFANALAASGAFRAEQVRLPSVINKTTEALKAQKLSFGQVFGKQGRANMKAVYRDQLALQNAFARQVTGGVGAGKSMMTLGVPTQVPKSWDNLSNRIGFFRAQLKSASVGMVNWGKNMQWSGRQLMTGLTLPVAAFGAAAGAMAYQVDKQFTRIKKVYDTTADANSTMASDMKAYAAEIADLQTKAFATAGNAAKEYGVSITDTMSVQADLAATGITGGKLQAATTQVMRNATLGEIDYQTATSATIALQQQLHLSNTELADSWAYMNSVENATSLGMKDFAEAIPIALAPIRAMGGDLQDLGTLMTAMVSRGIQVGKAANAIKALPQRLSRPSKQVQEEFRALTGQDIVELNKNNPDNIIGLLTAINDATKNLGTFDKRKALAGLFGSYQLSTMTAMIDGMADLGDTTTQTNKAFEIGTQDAKQWAEVSNREIKAFQDSAAGQFKIAFQSIKVELAKMGDPFLEVATRFLDVGKAIFGFFNNLPGIVKKGFIITILLGAILGPVLMLTGLFVQLAGNVGKMLASVLKLAKGMNILTLAEAATNLEASLMDKGFIKDKSSAELLQDRLVALTAATEAQAMAMRDMMAASAGAAGAMNAAGKRTLPIVKAYPSTPATPSQIQQSVQQALLQQGAATNKAGNLYKAKGTPGAGQMFTVEKAEAMRLATEATVRAQYTLAEAHMKTLGFLSLELAEAEKINAAQAFLNAKTKQELADDEARLAVEKSITAQKEAQAAMVAKYGTSPSMGSPTAAGAKTATTHTNPLSTIIQQQRNRTASTRAAQAYGSLPILPGTSKKELKAIKAAGKEVANMKKTEDKRLKTSAQRLKIAQSESKIQQATNRGAAGAAASSAAMAASMGLMMFTTNETANNIGKFLLVASIAAPAFTAIKVAMVASGAAAAKAVIKAKELAVASAASASGLARGAGAAGTMRLGLVGAKAAALSIMGPIGWAVTAMAVIGFALFKIHKSSQEKIREQITDQKALSDSAKDYADSLGDAVGQYDKIAQVTANGVGDSGSGYDEILKYYSEDKNGKNAIEGYNELDSKLQKDAQAMQLFTDTMVINKKTANEAMVQLTAFFAASGQSMAEASYNAQRLAKDVGDMTNFDYTKALANLDDILPQFTGQMDSKVVMEMVKSNAENYGKLWSAGFANAMDPTQADQFIQNLNDKALNGYSSMLEDLRNTDWNSEDQKNVDDFLKKVEDYSKANMVNQTEAFKALADDGTFQPMSIFGTEQGKGWAKAAENAKAYEERIVAAVVQANRLDDSIKSVDDLTKQALITSKTLTYKESVKSGQELLRVWRLNNASLDSQRDKIKALSEQDLKSPDKLREILSLMSDAQLKVAGLSLDEFAKISDEDLKNMNFTTDKLSEMVALGADANENGTLISLNQMNLVQGLIQGNGVLEAWNNLWDKNVLITEEAAEKVKGVKTNVDRLKDKTLHIKITADDAEEVDGLVKKTFEDVQSQMVDAANDQIDAAADASADALENYWDKKGDQLEDAQDKVQKRLEDAQQKAQDEFDRKQDKAGRQFSRKQDDEQEAFDKRWERRKNAIQKASDSRIAGIQKEIDAEQAADDARQAMFEAEKKRIDRLADSANRSIDFKVALSTGNIDEAAKIQNDIQATNASNANEDANDATSAASKAKIDALNKTTEAVQAQTDKELKNLEKAEAAARESFERRQQRAQRHFARMQELEQRAFQKTQDMQTDALAKTQEAARKAFDDRAAAAKAANAKEWADTKASLDSRLALFGAYTVSSQAQLETWMKKTGLSYKDFGMNSGADFSAMFSESLRVGAASIASDNMWSGLGAGIGIKTLKGMGFGGYKKFANFIKTGQLPDNFEKKISQNNAPAPTRTPNNSGMGPQINHGGGMIGDGGTGRKGVARTTKGVGPGERLVLARNKEFMVNERAAQANLPLLKAINSGRMNTSKSNVGTGIGGNVDPGIAGLAGGFVGVGMAAGVAQAFKNAFDNKMSAMASMGGDYSGVVGAGNYSLPGVMPWVLEAANYLGAMFNIKTIGGVGERGNKSEHPIGRALDFMTDGLSNSQGDALAAEVVKRHEALDAMYVIWRQKINSFDGRGWRDMEDRGSPTANHLDHVHVSFNPDGILGDLPKLTPGSKVGGTSFAPGSGGKAMPSIPGKGWANSHDYGNGVNSPLYAFNDAKVIESQALKGGTSKYAGSTPGYYSYGETMVLRDIVGNTLRYAHMAPNSRKYTVGDQVPGGSLIGLSGWTGNASGPHTHFEWNGSYGAQQGMAGYGISLDGSGAPARKGTGTGGEMDDAGVDSTGGWTYGDLPGQAGYDPYTSMNIWIENQRIEAESAAKKAERDAKKAALKAQHDALEMDVVTQGASFKSAKEKLELLRQHPKRNEGEINTWVWVKDQIKIRYDAAVAAFEAWKKANPNYGDEDVAAKAVAAGNDAGAQIKTGTYNVKFDSENSATKEDLKRLSERADILGLTEMSGGKRNLIPWLNDRGWGTYGESPSMLTWNNKKLERKDGGDVALNKTTGPFPGGQVQHATWGLFKDIASGQSFNQISAHTVPVPDKDANRRKIQAEQYASLKALQERLNKTAPTILSGDLNWSFEKDNKIEGLGLNNNWTNKDRDKYKEGTHVGGRSFLDYLLYKGMKMLSTDRFRGSSDHYGALGTFSIPSHANGAQNIRFDNTLANLHAGEGVLTEEQNSKFRNLANNIDQVAMGGETKYTTTVEVTNPNASADEIARKVEQVQRKNERRKAMRRTVSV